MFEIVITSSVLILALVLLRKIFWGKISRRLQYGLWILVVVRLLVPAALFTSSFSIMNVVEDVGEVVWQEDANDTDSDLIAQEMSAVNEGQYGNGTAHDAVHDAVNKPVNGIVDEATNTIVNGKTNSLPNEQLNATGTMAGNDSNTETDSKVSPDDQGQSSMQQGNSVIPEKEGLQGSSVRLANRWNQVNSLLENEKFLQVLLIIYIAGVIITGGTILFCNLKFRKRLMVDRQLLGKEGKLKVYLSSCISSPCLWGFGRPSIYLTENSLVSPERKKYILCHEMTHYRHRDHIWSEVRILCLVLYWFQPLVWVAAKLSMEDGELACDEGTVVRLGAESREAYGGTLIEMMTESEKKHQLLYCTTGMINSKEEIKKRITAIALYKKYAIRTAIPVIVLAVVLSACTAGKTEKPNSLDGAETAKSSEYTSERNDENTDGKADEKTDEEIEIADDVVMNADGTFRLAEYEVDLTEDDVKEKIVFDVAFSEELNGDGSVITNQMLWEKLWNGSEISVRILDGVAAETLDTDVEEVILEEYDFSEMQSGKGNLAVVKRDGKNYIMRYGNQLEQGSGTFGYDILQIRLTGEDSLVIDELSASYTDPDEGENSKEVIDQVLVVSEKLDQYLDGAGTRILLSAAENPEKCYLYGSENDLYDKGRRQSAFNVFMTEAGGSGLELKLEDYFYPNGQEPLTKLPEEAEERIRGGEILLMEINQDNSTAGRLDLDGDGEKEVLYLEALGPNYNGNGWNDWGYIDSNFRVRVNEQYYESSGSNVDPVLMAFSPDGEQILLAVYDDGPSGDPLTSFYRYDEAGVHMAGQIYDDLRTVSSDEEGVIACTFRADMIQTEWAWNYYEWNGSEMVRREDEIYYYVDDSQWREQDQVPLLLLKEITVYAERSESSGATVMKPQKVRNVATDGVEWILLEAEDGTVGWIRCVNGHFPAEEAEVTELFEGRVLVD